MTNFTAAAYSVMLTAPKSLITINLSAGNGIHKNGCSVTFNSDANMQTKGLGDETVNGAIMDTSGVFTLTTLRGFNVNTKLNALYFAEKKLATKLESYGDMIITVSTAQNNEKAFVFSKVAFKKIPDFGFGEESGGEGLVWTFDFGESLRVMI